MGWDFRVASYKNVIICWCAKNCKLLMNFEILQLQDSLSYSRAYWVSESVIAWNVDVGDGSCYLYSSKIAALSIGDGGIIGLDFTILPICGDLYN